VGADIGGRDGHNFQKLFLGFRPLAAVHGRLAGLESLTALRLGISSLRGESRDAEECRQRYSNSWREGQLTMLALPAGYLIESSL